jgi:hypothetical protein
MASDLKPRMLFLDAFIDKGRLRAADNGLIRFALADEGSSTWVVRSPDHKSRSLSPQQVVQRWNSFFRQKNSDFAATFQVDDDIDTAPLKLATPPTYKARSGKIIFDLKPFNPTNKATLKSLTGKNLYNLNLFSSAKQLSIPKVLRRQYAQALATPISDGDAWRMKPNDAYFAKISPQDITEWRARTSPFILSDSQWNEFVNDLYSALKRDGFDQPVDIRLNGSTARLFSNPTKDVPKTARDAITWYESEQNIELTQDDARDIITRYDQWLGPESKRQTTDIPRYRFVDLMHRLGLGDRSDIDLQISSDTIARRVIEVAAQDGISPENTKRQPYGFYDKQLVAKALPNTTSIMQKWSDNPDPGIDFTFALFDSIGPLNSIAHFRNNDWLVGSPNLSGFNSPNWYSSEWSG